MERMNIAVPHPGRILLELFVEPNRSNALRLSLELKLEPRRLLDLINGRRSFTVETALRLAHYFGTTPEYWLELQMQYDLEQAQSKWSERIESEITPLSERDNAWKPPEGAQNVREKKEYKNPKIDELKKEIENLSTVEKSVFEMLGKEPQDFDAIAYALNIQGGALGSSLVLLEFKGLVKRLPGELYLRAPGLEEV